jgi:hypothetical protein
MYLKLEDGVIPSLKGEESHDSQFPNRHCMHNTRAWDSSIVSRLYYPIDGLTHDFGMTNKFSVTLRLRGNSLPSLQ